VSAFFNLVNQQHTDSIRHLSYHEQTTQQISNANTDSIANQSPTIKNVLL